MKDVYDHNLGIQVRSHLLNLNLETVNNLKYYSLNDNERIRAIAKNVKEINLVMGIVTDESHAMDIARNIYNSNQGLSYKHFPHIDIKDQSFNGTTTLNTTLNNLPVKYESSWETTFVNLNYKGTFKNTNPESVDINKIILFFSKRPYNKVLFKSQVETTIKQLYKTESFSLYFEE